MAGQNERTGLWLIGAYGGVATTVAVGIAALKRGLTQTTALATAAKPFSHLPFPSFDTLVLGGHDVRQASFGSSARDLLQTSSVFSDALLAGVADDLDAWSDNVRPGALSRSGAVVEAFADWAKRGDRPTTLAQVQRATSDLLEFKQRHQLQRLIVVNVSSSEPMATGGIDSLSWSQLNEKIQRESQVLPASSIYGLAAIEAGASYVNFTPSVGLSLPALEERAKQAGILYMGKDGKTGETLMKAVLAPMFVRRNLNVLSWVGHNILGNRDGKVLQDPVNKQGKIESKGHLIGEILGYEPQTLVSIEHIESMGDWKTAWDHIHFKGFLDTKMSLQFIWQGCDSLLAAPLVIDLVRWTQLAQKRGETGVMQHLAGYFKSPMGVAEQDFFRQWDLLENYAKQAGG